ncbi:MAG TPA: glycine cleavage system protein H, partial [Candidatus Bathyarchaeota archaeon]|nr:glycine cleavage system protein H [Candidatus Bathyarchaeota archaeon]
MVEIEGYYLPEDRYYTDRNLWLKPEPDGTIKVGFNDLAQKLIGKVAFVRLMPKGKHIDKDRFFGTVESAKWVERLKMPISGTIEE